MKRRLTKAYDAMTMPDRCSDAILQRLQLEQEIREAGENKKLVTPVSRKKPWLAAIGAVCAAVVLSACGSLLFLYGSQSMLAAPTEAVAAEGEKTPEDHYAAATQLTVEEVETFAKIVRSNILTENWTALGDKIQYPIIIKGSEIDNAQEFVARMEELRLGSQVREALEQPLGGDAAGFLRGGGKALLAQEFDGLVHVTVGLGEGFLAVHHAAAGALTQGSNIFSSEVHSISPQ